MPPSRPPDPDAPAERPSSRAPASATLHTFVFADLAGYTALTEAHGDEQAADAAAEFCRAVRSLLSDHHAEEVKVIGDALMLRVPDAVAAARLAERIVCEHGVRHHALGVRVGMHTGTAVRRGADWFGSGVNLAARVADVARSGEVLLTDATREAFGGSVPTSPRGRRTFKNVPRAVVLHELTVREGRRPARLPVDPVCRMAVDPVLAVRHDVYRGVEYHFCSDRCHEAFTQDPARFTRAGSAREHLLVSDAARERATARLRRAYQRGRLDREDLERRTEGALAARTRGELSAVLHGLPRPRGPRGGFLRRLARRLRRRLRRS